MKSIKSKLSALPFLQKKSSKVIRNCFLCSLLFILSFCLAEISGRLASPNDRFDKLCNSVFTKLLSDDTLSLHYCLAHPENYKLDQTPISLGSHTKEAFLDHMLYCENLNKFLESFQLEDLDSRNQVLHSTLQYYVDQQKAGQDYYYYDEPLDPIHGDPFELPILFCEYAFYKEEDVTQYLLLLGQIPKLFAEIETFEREKANQGLFVSEATAGSIRQGLQTYSKLSGYHALTESFQQKLNDLSSLSAEEKCHYMDIHKRLIETVLIPAYQSLDKTIEELEPFYHSNEGLYSYEKGNAYYDYLVSCFTNTSSGTKRLFDQIAKKRQNDVFTMSSLIHKDPNLMSSINDIQLPFNTPEQMLEHLKYSMQSDFPAPPNVSCEVKQVLKSQAEISSPAFYLMSPMDQYEKNTIYINPFYELEDIDLFTTLAHEGYPGHLYQTISSYEKELHPLQYLLRTGAYTEGWATYVEFLSYNYAGIDDEEAKLLSLNASITLSLYATIDIGVHAYGWDEEKVHAFLSEYGITDFTASKDAFFLVLESPGNYLKYYGGYLQFESLKEQIKKQHGTAYSDYAFHTALLDLGPAPFPVIEQFILPAFRNLKVPDTLHVY